MANMLLASSSSKSILTPTIISSPKPRLSLSLSNKLPIPSTPSAKQPLILKTLKTLKTTLVVPLSLTLMTPLPSLAEEIEKASLFDFNLTLPIIMAEFLILMFALDKIYFTPLGDFMDSRDSEIKGKLSDVKDSSEELKQLEEQANAIMRAARAEISAALNKMKKETQLEVEAQLAEGRKKVEAELQEALSNLEKQKEDTILALDSQIAAISEDIVKKVLPVS